MIMWHTPLPPPGGEEHGLTAQERAAHEEWRRERKAIDEERLRLAQQRPREWDREKEL